MRHDPMRIGTIHDQLCRCRACKPGLDAPRPAPSLRSAAVNTLISAAIVLAASILSSL